MPLNDTESAMSARLPGTPDQLAAFCLEALTGGWGEDWDAPLVNPVGDLAAQLFSGLRRGAVSVEGLKALIQHFADEGLAARARALSALHGDGLSGGAEADVRGQLEALAEKGFDVFAATVTRKRGGVVFTAHPTFALSRAVRDALASAAVTGEAEALVGAGHVHGPDPDVSLINEHDEAMAAVEAARGALTALNALVLDVARAAFPDRWRTLDPDLISLASWVGYDLDGRTDIHWGRSIAFRLQEKSRQLMRYADLLEASGASGLDPLAARLRAAGEASAEHAALFEADLDDPSAVVRAANALTADYPGRLTSLSGVIAELDRAIGNADDDVAARLALLRAEMKAAGLGAAHIHLRINAAQLRGAVRADLGLEDDSDDFGRLALTRAAERAAEAQVRTVSFASVFLEQMTARRQFMLCAQLLKHVDSDAPIRFLIAECETAATVMGALYLARLYGVTDHVDISPLFETPDALERGGRLIERLLAEPVYRDYIAGRGRLAIQLGYSDSGRFMGQGGAQLAIERLHILTARALARYGVKGVAVVVFNTHGESMGRGAHPGGFDERLDHLLTPWARGKFAAAGAPVIHETSYQGGDGFLHFARPELAHSVMMSTARHLLAEPGALRGDPFYAEIDYTWDVYRSLKAWQESLFDNADYRTAVTAFAPNMLVRSGSRRARALICPCCAPSRITRRCNSWAFR